MPDGKLMVEVYHHLGRRLQFPWLPLGLIRSGKNLLEVPLECIRLHDKPQRYARILSQSLKAAFIKVRDVFLAMATCAVANH
ncbi:hypothetical protein GCK32_020006 [Trichostrongylus colubriformis]|uniref:Uncharacterized protein n=1 Tax=Trichostrongylus colubriformis TaxID=6319 RepID=A0AAN8FDE2_TRICO